MCDRHPSDRYFPMQKRLKIVSRTSSFTSWPLTSPSATAAPLKSIVQKSRGSSCSTDSTHLWPQHLGHSKLWVSLTQLGHNLLERGANLSNCVIRVHLGRRKAVQSLVSTGVHLVSASRARKRASACLSFTAHCMPPVHPPPISQTPVTWTRKRGQQT